MATVLTKIRKSVTRYEFSIATTVASDSQIVQMEGYNEILLNVANAGGATVDVQTKATSSASETYRSAIDAPFTDVAKPVRIVGSWHSFKLVWSGGTSRPSAYGATVRGPEGVA